MGHTRRRSVYVFLCIVPLLAIALAAPRSLRIAGLYQSIGAMLFAATATAVWILAGRTKVALAGGFFVAPFALIALCWVGLGPPWTSTVEENVMRYFVLLISSIAVTCGFVVLKDALTETGERYYSTLGFAAAILAGAAYLVWMSFMLGIEISESRGGQPATAFNNLLSVLDILLSVGCLLTYLATAAFAAAMRLSGWLEPGPARAYVTMSFVALLCLLLRGMSFPDPAALSTPWYTRPGFVAGIPAIPFLMPFWLGVVLLWRSTYPAVTSGSESGNPAC